MREAKGKKGADQALPNLLRLEASLVHTLLYTRLGF